MLFLDNDLLFEWKTDNMKTWIPKALADPNNKSRKFAEYVPFWA